MTPLSVLGFSFVSLLGCDAGPVSETPGEHDRGGRSPSVAVERATEAAPSGPLRVHEVGDGDGRVMVLLHGFGASGDDLVDLARSLRGTGAARFLLPEAPIELSQQGRAWWKLDRRKLMRARVAGQPRDLSQTRPEGLVEARRAVLEMLEAAERRLGVPVSQMMLGGFSQGAMLALDVALHAPEPPAGVAVLSGAPVAMSEWEPRLARLRGVPVLISHGRGDRLLSFQAAERLSGQLEEAGARVTFMPFDGGHTIPGPVRGRLADWMDRPVED
ncbi:MAG: alpha/beta hydrolase [Myxococcota bacterium]